METSNVINFDQARARVAQRGNEKRMHPRLEAEDRLFAQVVLSADEPDLVGATLSCTTVNLSVGGIQFRTNSSVPAGSLLDLWVDIASRPGKFFLSGEVRWARPANSTDVNGNPEWVIGVQLKSGAATDIVEWRNYHATAYAR